MLKNYAIKFNGFVKGRTVSRETDIGDGWTLLTQLDAKDVNVLSVDGQKLGKFIAQLFKFALDDILGLFFFTKKTI